MSVIFSENWQFNHKFGLPLSSTNVRYLKDYPHNLPKYESKGLQKFQFSYSLVNWEKIGSAAQAYIQKTEFSIYFMNWEKLRWSNIQKFQNLFVNWEKPGSTAED